MSNRARSGRGFSFMTDPESDAAALKFIERDDLDRTWKSTIRERQKVQETRIWEDFCQNQDILQSIYQDDPYQFLENLPDTYIKELERIEKFDVNSVIQENSVQPESLAGGDSSNTCIQVRGDGEDFIPFIQEPTAESETTDRQLSLESEKEEGDQPQEIYIQSPCTVRESTKHEQQLSACDQQYYSLGQQHPDRDHQHSGRDQQHYGRDQQHSGRDQQHSGRDQQYGRDLLHSGLDQIHSGRDQQHSGRDQPNSGRAQYSNKQTPQNSDRTKEKCELKKIKKDNVVSKPSPTPAFEANMYFEKVRGLRFKINEVLLCIIELFDDQIEDDYDPIEIRKLQKRANEFSGRFTRIYMYQLSRQLNDLKRSMKLSLPFAKRTQFQSQVTRVVSLHQNTLQALQVFHRPLETALCLGDSGHHLQSLVKFIRESSELCADVVPSNDLRPKVEDMYNDDIPISCFKIEKLLKKYLIKLRVMMEAAAEPTPRSAKPAKTSSNQRDAKQLQLPYRRKMASQKRKHSPKYNTGARLSMYSLDNLRLNLNPKQTVSKENQTSKVDTNAADKPGSVSQTNLVKYPGKHSPFPRKSAKKPDKNEAAAEAAKKSQSQVASSRKPLMRDSNKAGGPTKKKNVRDEDIRTMVETFGSNCVTNRSWSEKAQSPSPKSAALSAKSPKSTGLSANSPKSVALSPKSAAPSPKSLKTAAEPEKEQRGARGGATGCDVTRLLHRLCGGAGERPPNANRNERVSGASNAQLVCVSSNSPRPTSTPQLLKILEENIQKKSSPFPVEHPETSAKSNIPEKLLLHFNIPEQTSDSAQNYRTQFIQYMMSSPMYANSALKKPWEMIGRVSDKIIEELLLSCVAEMQLEKVLQEIYCSEVN